MPSRPLLFLYRLARVHQDDRSSSLARFRPLLKNLLTNAPSVSSQHFGCPSHLTTQEVLSKCTPKDVLPKCTPKNVLSKCIPKNVLSKCTLRTCYPSAHPRTCYPSAWYTRVPLCTLVHYSCSTSYSCAPISCTTRTRAPLVLVHHPVLVHRSIISYTTRAPLRTLVHQSCSCTTHAPLRTLVHLSRVPLVHHSVISCTTQVLSCTTLVHHSHAPLT